MKLPIHDKNHGITFIITYPPNLENIVFFCLQLGYSIGLHVHTETNYLAKHHSSLFPTQVSARLLVQ